MSRVLGIDLGGTTARVLEGRLEKGAFAIHHAASVPVDELAAHVEAHGLKGLPVVVGVTGRDMILRVTQVPPLPEGRLRELLAYEVEDIAEQSGDALRADFELMPGPGTTDDEERVLLALVRSSHIDERSAELAAARLKVAAYTPNAVALHNAVVATHGGDGTVLAVHLRGQNTDVALLRDGELLFARNLAGGGDTLTEAVARTLGVGDAEAQEAKHLEGVFAAPGEKLEGQAEAVARALDGAQRQLVGMLQSSVALARNQLQAPELEVERVLLCGPGAALPGLTNALTRTMGLPVERFDATDGYVVGDALAFGERGADFAVPAGLAMMHLLDGSFRVEVLSEAAEKKQRFQSSTLWLVLATVLVVAHLALYAWTSRADHDAALRDRLVLSRAVEANSSERRAYERSVTEGRELGARLAALEQLSAPGAGLLTVLDLLAAHLPEELWLREVRTVRGVEPGFGGGGTVRPFVVVEGGGKELDRNLADAVVELTTRLRSHPDVAAVLPHFAPDARGRFAWELRIDTSVVPPEAADGAEADTARADADRDTGRDTGREIGREIGRDTDPDGEAG